jgi:hypothetical protein
MRTRTGFAEAIEYLVILAAFLAIGSQFDPNLRPLVSLLGF